MPISRDEFNKLYAQQQAERDACKVEVRKLLAAGDEISLRRACRELLKYTPDFDPELYRLYAQALRQSGKPDEAIEAEKLALAQES
jgi:hypothetical protein